MDQFAKMNPNMKTRLNKINKKTNLGKIYLILLGLSYEECRPGDSLFIQTQDSLEVNDSLGESPVSYTHLTLPTILLV